MTGKAETKFPPSVSWEEAMLPGLRDVPNALALLESVAEEHDPNLLRSTLSDVLSANLESNLRLCHYVITAYGRYLGVRELRLLADKFPMVSSHIDAHLDLLTALETAA